jgi:acyl-CoA hydrolase
MITQVRPGLDRPSTTDYGNAVDDDRVERAAAALESNGMAVFRAADAAEARRIVLGLIPEGADVYHGASQTLDATGITEAIEQSGRYEPLRPRIRTMDRATEADQLRRLSAAPDVMLGSVHAVTEDGSLITASMGGGQLGPYVSGAGRVILVVGRQKIVSDLWDGLRRVYEHSLPLEDARAFEAYGIHSAVNKLLIINREITPGRITVVLIDEVVGF